MGRVLYTSIFWLALSPLVALAHVEVLPDGTLPPHQPTTEALIIGYIAITVALVATGVFLFWSHKKSALTKQALAVRQKWTPWVASLVFISALGATWDVWWHFGVGVAKGDPWYIAPHLIAQLPPIFVGVISFFAWRKTKDWIWMKIMVVLFLLLGGVIADDGIWHRLFNAEQFHELWIAWSPTHVYLTAMFALLNIVVLTLVLTSSTGHTRRLFGTLVFALIGSYLLFMSTPFIPISQWQEPWAVLGFWGSGIDVFWLAAMFVSAQEWIKGKGVAFMVSAFFLVNLGMLFGNDPGVGVTVIPHNNPPIGLSIFSFVAAGGAADIFRNRRAVERGIILAIVYTLIIYAGSWYFFAPEFRYSMGDALVAISSGVVGGIAGGAFALFLKKVNFFHRA